MAMAGLGRPTEIWGWPFHLFMAVRREYIKALTPPVREEDKTETTEIAPGITMETKLRD